MSKVSLLLVVVLVVGCVLSGPVVNAPAGPVSGVTTSGIDAFLGIPFAEPPVGSKRWMPPTAKAPWKTTLQASSFGNSCMQSISPSFKVPLNTSEDCLFLNVWRRSSNPDASKLPVMVWIYGGNYVSGTSTIYPLHDMLAKADENVVLVSLNYRVNIFGFMVADGKSYNYGLMDQQLALQWVQQNIAAFGGDPERVTIFGESAGGNSVSMHMLMPKSFDLYHQAIMESPAPWVYAPISAATKMRSAIAQTLGCNSSDGNSEVACMRGVDAKDLYKVVLASHLLFQPVVGDPQLPQQPFVMWRNSAFNKKAALVVGDNTDEGNLFAFVSSGHGFSMSSTVFYELVNASLDPFGMTVRDDVLALYNPIIQRDGYWVAYATLIQDVGILCGGRRVADSAVGGGAPVYRYLFAHHTSDWTFTPLNATHTSEIPYVMNTEQILAAKFLPDEAQLAQRMSDAWIHFAVAGAPTRDGSWPLYVPNTASIMEFNIQSRIVQEGLLYTRCPFWDELINHIFA